MDAGTGLHPDVLPDHEVLSQYREHQTLEPRPADGAPDLGAFELPEPGMDTGLAAGLVALGLVATPEARRESSPLRLLRVCWAACVQNPFSCSPSSRSCQSRGVAGRSAWCPAEPSGHAVAAVPESWAFTDDVKNRPARDASRGSLFG